MKFHFTDEGECDILNAEEMRIRRNEIMIKAVFFDVDGTLLSLDTGTVPESH